MLLSSSCQSSCIFQETTAVKLTIMIQRSSNSDVCFSYKEIPYRTSTSTLERVLWNPNYEVLVLSTRNFPWSSGKEIQTILCDDYHDLRGELRKDSVAASPRWSEAKGKGGGAGLTESGHGQEDMRVRPFREFRYWKAAEENEEAMIP